MTLVKFYLNKYRSEYLYFLYNYICNSLVTKKQAERNNEYELEREIRRKRLAELKIDIKNNEKNP